MSSHLLMASGSCPLFGYYGSCHATVMARVEVLGGGCSVTLRCAPGGGSAGHVVTQLKRVLSQPPRVLSHEVSTCAVKCKIFGELQRSHGQPRLFSGTESLWPLPVSSCSLLRSLLAWGVLS